MTQAVPPVGVQYASSQSCNLCAQQPISDKTIYGHPVCQSCYSGFMWRRLGAYVIDSLIMIIPSILIGLTVGLISAGLGGGFVIRTMFNLIATAITSVIFAMKDGINGQSPARMMLDLQVLDNTTGRPIGFMQSLQRNSFILLNIIPFIGWVPALVLILIIAFTLGKGYRIGDAFANTKVVWRRFANSPIFRVGNELVAAETPSGVGLSPSAAAP